MKITFIPLLISFGFLTVYAIDTAVMQTNPAGLFGIDAFSKGLVLGVPSLGLPFVSYVLQKNRPSKIIPTLLALNGGLIIVGGLIMIGVTSGSQFDAIRLNLAIEATIILGIAVLQIILAVKSNKIPSLVNYR